MNLLFFSHNKKKLLEVNAIFKHKEIKVNTLSNYKKTEE